MSFFSYDPMVYTLLLKIYPQEETIDIVTDKNDMCLHISDDEG